MAGKYIFNCVLKSSYNITPNDKLETYCVNLCFWGDLAHWVE